MRIIIPSIAGIILAVAIVTVFSVWNITRLQHESLKDRLTSQVTTIMKMLEREHDLKFSKVINDLKVAHHLFYNSRLEVSDERIRRMVTNQVTGIQHEAELRTWKLNGSPVIGDTAFVDLVRSLVGGTVTIFQRIDSGFVRISTNVPRSDGSRAFFTYIPNNSLVVQTILRGETYFGRAWVVNAWYITAYEPILMNGRIAGMLYVGDQEKDLEKLKEKVENLHFGLTGFPVITDSTGHPMILSTAVSSPGEVEKLIQRLGVSGKGTGMVRSDLDGKKRLVVWDYFPGFRSYVLAVANVKDEAAPVLRNLMLSAGATALILILALSLFVYRITSENIRSFLAMLERSSSDLEKTTEALRESEKHFQTLFNSSSDQIYVLDFEGNFLEVNQQACTDLGYTRDQLLRMNVMEIKPEAYKNRVARNLEAIRKFGSYRYESENISSDGRIIPVEMKSRVIRFRGKRVILTIARDITERREMEDKILTTIIRTEEKERNRLAADLHDDLGPVLSTIKLYTGLLRKKAGKPDEFEEAVNNVEEMVDMAISTTRNISRNIRSNILNDFGLAAAINDFVNYLRKTERVEIDLATHEYRLNKRGIEESVLFQVVKELINNTLKHSGASKIRIELKSSRDQAILYYRDNGHGFDLKDALERNEGLGLNNILNKIKSIKGTADIHSEPGEGMFLIASVTIKNSNSND
ncbi:MAG: hypothetical protein Kow00127_21380 [Bacteroidales bacterium]